MSPREGSSYLGRGHASASRLLVSSWILIFTLAILASAELKNQPCDVLPSGCTCSHKSKRGLRISCVNLGIKSLNLTFLPKEEPLDIDLSSNKIEALMIGLFPNPNKIRRLVLTDNNISIIESGAFDGFQSLKTLDLSRNRVMVVNESTFVGLNKGQAITRIALNENRILYIHPLAFKGTSIKTLSLSKQLNSNSPPSAAVLLSYPDFLSESNVEKVELDSNNLLCDCRMSWLQKWALVDGHDISPGTRCGLPLELEGKSVLDQSGSCNEFPFRLPEFRVMPSNDQVLIAMDDFVVRCVANWLPDGELRWFKDGMPVNGSEKGLEIRHGFNLATAKYDSVLRINKLSAAFAGNLSCRFAVNSSGVLVASIGIKVLDLRSDFCPLSVTDSSRGFFAWTSTVAGGGKELPCPFGGVTRGVIKRQCGVNGSWDAVNENQCLPQSSVTRALVALDQSMNSSSEVKALAKDFSSFLQVNHSRFATQEDLYYAYRILAKIVNAYSNSLTLYSRFFLSCVSTMSSKNDLPAMGLPFDGKVSGERFRELLEMYAGQVAEQGASSIQAPHQSELSVYVSESRARLTQTYHCYMYRYSDGQRKGLRERLMNTYCSTHQNITLFKMCSVWLQLPLGNYLSGFRLTSVTYDKDTFFQSPQSLSGNYTIASPVVGVRVAEPIKRIRKSLESAMHAIDPAVLTFVNFRGGTNPRLLFWQRKTPDSYEEWSETPDCHLLVHNENITQFQCTLYAMANFTYLAMAMDFPPRVPVQRLKMENVVLAAAVISSIILLVVFLTYAAIRSIRFNRSDAASLMNLCFAIAILEIAFAFGINRVDNYALCQAVAVVLHYFSLAVLLWLGCGGAAVVRLLRSKDTLANHCDPILKYYLIGWGFPAIVCGITLAADRANYVTDSVCWLNGMAAFVACIGPGALILLIDLIILCSYHAMINRKFPDPGSDEVIKKERAPLREQAEPPPERKRLIYVSEFAFPERGELLDFLKGHLLIMLLFVMLYVFVIMMFVYRGKKSRYLYVFFYGAAAVTMLVLSFSVVIYHCARRGDVRVHADRASLRCLAKQRRSECCWRKGSSTKMELQPLSAASAAVSDEFEIATVVSMENPSVIDVRTALSEAGRKEWVNATVPSEESNPVVSLRVVACQAFDGRGTSSLDSLQGHNVKFVDSDAQLATLPCSNARPALERQPSRASSNSVSSSVLQKSLRQLPVVFQVGGIEKEDCDSAGDSRLAAADLPGKAPRATSDHSESERCSAAPSANAGSVGKGGSSVASKSRVQRPVNPNIPDNLKAFVPETWRPVRRRGHKNASFYPYYHTGVTPVAPPVSYGSPASSSTNIVCAGVPLYIHARSQPSSAASSLAPNSLPRCVPANRVRQPFPANQPPNAPLIRAMHNIMESPVLLPTGMAIGASAIPSVPPLPKNSGLAVPNPRYLFPPPPPPPPPPALSPLQIPLSPTSPSTSLQSQPNMPAKEASDRQLCALAPETGSESEAETLAVVAPVVYVALPHVTRKQFELRSETQC